MGHPAHRKFVIIIDNVPTYSAQTIQEIVDKLKKHYGDRVFANFTRHTVYNIRNGFTKKYHHIQIREESG